MNNHIKYFYIYSLFDDCFIQTKMIYIWDKDFLILKTDFIGNCIMIMMNIIVTLLAAEFTITLCTKLSKER